MIQASIVLPTYNRLKQLKQVIAALEAQSVSWQDFEVIVVSDGSSDGTNEYLTTIETRLQLVSVLQDNQGVASARNQGIRHAKGHIIVFIDDDVIPTPQLLEEHLKIHRNAQRDVVVLGPMLTPPEFDMQPWVRWEQAMLEKQYKAMTNGEWTPTAHQFYTGNASLARHLLAMIGGFDTKFRRAEDVELAYRLADHGVEFIFNQKAIGYHYAARSFHSWFNTPYLYGRNDVIFARDKGQGWLLDKICREFKERHFIIRLLTMLCLSRWLLRDSTIGALKLLAAVANWLKWERIVFGAYSGIFNLRHYQGMADELGGREHFMYLCGTESNSSYALETASEQR